MAAVRSADCASRKALSFTRRCQLFERGKVDGAQCFDFLRKARDLGLQRSGSSAAAS